MTAHPRWRPVAGLDIDAEIGGGVTVYAEIVGGDEDGPEIRVTGASRYECDADGSGQVEIDLTDAIRDAALPALSAAAEIRADGAMRRARE